MSEETVPEGRMLVYFREKSYQSMAGNYEEFIPKFEQCIKSFNDFDIGELEQKEFIPLFINYDDLVKQKRLKKPGEKYVEFAGEKISRERLIEISEKPKGYYTLKAEIEKISNLIELRCRSEKAINSLNVKTVRDFLRLFEFNNEGKLILEESIYEDIKSHYSLYVTSEQAKKMVIFAKAFEAFMQENYSHHIYPKDRYNEFITSIVHFAPGDDEVTIDYDFIKRADSFNF